MYYILVISKLRRKLQNFEHNRFFFNILLGQYLIIFVFRFLSCTPLEQLYFTDCFAFLFSIPNTGNLDPICNPTFIRSFLVDAQTFFCDFDDNTNPLCGFEQGDRLFGDDFDWTRLSGPTPSENTGPDYDHSTGNQGRNYF